jgi:hypothetical protein
MKNITDTERLLQTHFDGVPTSRGTGSDRKVLADALAAMQQARREAAPSGRMAWRTIMTSRWSRFAAAVGAAAAVLFVVLQTFDEPAWALEEAIEALKKYRAVHIVGAIPGGTAEIWMRASQSGTGSSDTVVRFGSGAVAWTDAGVSYYYDPSQNTLYFEHALTIGLSEWLGPELLDVLSTVENAKIVHGRDPATGRNRVTVLCSLVDVNGAQSFAIEFDRESKLPVAIRQWQNLDRSGPPSFDAFRIVYHEELPDSLFDVRVPAGAARVEKPLQIPDAAVGALANRADGIPADGLTQQEAAARVVRMLYQAVIDQDLDALKRVCPLCRNMGDEFVRAIVFKPGKDTRIVQVLDVGPIRRTGRSALGPIVAIPATLRLQNGSTVEEQMIVQFRQFGERLSCVVHGPYGQAREVR